MGHGYWKLNSQELFNRNFVILGWLFMWNRQSYCPTVFVVFYVSPIRLFIICDLYWSIRLRKDEQDT